MSGSGDYCHFAFCSYFYFLFHYPFSIPFHFVSPQLTYLDTLLVLVFWILLIFFPNFLFHMPNSRLPPVLFAPTPHPILSVLASSHSLMTIGKSLQFTFWGIHDLLAFISPCQLEVFFFFFNQLNLPLSHLEAEDRTTLPLWQVKNQYKAFGSPRGWKPLCKCAKYHYLLCLAWGHSNKIHLQLRDTIMWRGLICQFPPSAGASYEGALVYVSRTCGHTTLFSNFRGQTTTSLGLKRKDVKMWKKGKKRAWEG